MSHDMHVWLEQVLSLPTTSFRLPSFASFPVSLSSSLFFLLPLGAHNWPLPSCELPHPEGLQQYKLFAKFLLQGKVRDEE